MKEVKGLAKVANCYGERAQEALILEIQDLLREKGLSLMDVAKRGRMSYTTIFEIFRNPRKAVRLRTMIKLVECLGKRLCCGGECTPEGIVAMLNEERAYRGILLKHLASASGISQGATQSLLGGEMIGRLDRYMTIANCLDLDFNMVEANGAFVKALEKV